MASQGYRDWIRAGRPYTLIRPARAVQATLLARGITVWDFPDESHQKAELPEDHTPYSATGWPGPNARWKARGLDIMPRSDSKAHRKENADIARQMIRDRDAGVPGAMWIKYINWTDEDGVCRQERWMSSSNPLQRTTRSSSDRGHVHVSGRSDADNDTRADGYDPVARMRGLTTGDEMANTWTFQDQAPADQWRITQNAGASYLTGQARDTVLAIAASHSVTASAGVQQLVAAAAADEARDQAALAAIQALTKVIEAAGGSVEMAPILAEIRAVREETHAGVVQLQQQLTESQQREQAALDELAALRADNEGLRQRLAAAYAPEA
ncbi:hypothetical protein [Dactylosporangium sp. NPDC000521]|uniref:hypothetical protein n=1 Tax=Dactylosporangium sp. NPDC000521 TaxID=3363975 RepID=UPI003682C61A